MSFGRICCFAWPKSNIYKSQKFKGMLAWPLIVLNLEDMKPKNRIYFDSTHIINVNTHNKYEHISYDNINVIHFLEGYEMQQSFMENSSLMKRWGLPERCFLLKLILFWHGPFFNKGLCLPLIFSPLELISLTAFVKSFNDYWCYIKKKQECLHKKLIHFSSVEGDQCWYQDNWLRGRGNLQSAVHQLWG